MDNSDKPLRFQDKIIKCSCNKIIGKQICDGQLLILEFSDLAVFNWMRARHSCGKIINWESPNLLNELLPDSLQDLPAVGTVMSSLVGAKIIDF